MNKEAGSLIKYYKTGQEEDGYKGYSTNYQDLNIDVYKEELWKIVRDILILQAKPKVRRSNLCGGGRR